MAGFSNKIIVIGTSKGVVIPYHILKELGLKKGDMVRIEVKKINKEEK